MKTRVSVVCDAILEAGWLLALVLVPLFFNLYSSRVFEPDKIALLRSLATLMSVALVVKWIEESNGSLRERLAQALRTPLVIPALLTAGVYLLSTALSVSPRVSLLGSYQRLQGTYTWLSYLVIFASLLASLRRREQVDRLLNVLILASLPIALYGIIQHYQLDPLPWGGDVTFRVAANMGNAIFVAAYLIMVAPLTISRLITLHQDTARAAPESGRWLTGATVALFVAQIAAFALGGYAWGLFSGLAGTVTFWALAQRRGLPMGHMLSTAILCWALSAQLLCIFYSQSRGPWLGLAAGLAMFALLLAFARRWRKGLYAVLALTVLLGGLLGWLNLSSSGQAERIREVPYVGRLGELLSVQSGTGKVRVLIWQGAADMAFDAPLRTIVGYGPESMYVAYPPFYNAELGQYESRNATPDRSHNELFDALVTTGLIGLAAYVLAFMAVFYLALKWLGLVPDRRRRDLMLAILAGSGALGILLPLLIDGSLRYMGVGLPLALLAGIVIYTLVVTLGQRDAQQPVNVLEPWRVSLLIGIVAAVAAHWVEIHLGIAIASTRTLFWTLAGVLAAVVSLPTAEQTVVAVPRARSKALRRVRKQENHRQQGLLPGLLSGTIGCVLVWNYITNPAGETDPFRILWQSFTTMNSLGQPETVNLAIPGLLLASLATAIIMLVAGAMQNETDAAPGTWARSLTVAAVIAVPMMLLYGLLHAANIDTRESIHNLIYGFAALMLALWVALAALLTRDQDKPRTTSRSALSWLGLPLLAGALLLSANLNLAIIKADVIYKEAQRYEAAGRWEEAAGIYGQAVELAPTEDYYMLFEGRALLQLATLATDDETRALYFPRALQALQHAADMSPDNPDHAANIARLYSRWAELASDPVVKQEKRILSAEAYTRAVTLSPGNVIMLNEWAIALIDLGRYDEALQVLDRSLSLDATYGPTYQAMGELYYRQEVWSQALGYYEKASGKDPQNASLLTAVGHCHANLEQWDQATEWYSRTVELTPDSAQAWLYLGNSQEGAGNLSGAQSAYTRASMLSPNSETALRRLVSVSILSEDLEAAESALQQLLGLAPNDWTVQHDLALVYSEQGRTDQALAAIEQAHALAPETEYGRIEALLDQIIAQEGNTP